MKTKILFITHEMSPYTEETNQSEVVGLITKGIHKKTRELRGFMPRFGSINERKHRLHEVIRLSGINVQVGKEDNPLILKVASMPSLRFQIYFFDNEDYFKRKAIYADKNGEPFEDNDERIIFFCKGSVRVLIKLGWNPDIIHVHGWMSSMVPVYGRKYFKNEPAFKNAKIIYSLYDKDFDTRFKEGFADKAHIKGKYRKDNPDLEQPDETTLKKYAMQNADAITFGSPNIEPELIEYAKTLNVPILEYSDHNEKGFVERYEELYNSLIK